MTKAAITIPTDRKGLRELALRQAAKIVQLEQMVQIQAAHIRLIQIKNMEPRASSFPKINSFYSMVNLESAGKK